MRKGKYLWEKRKKWHSGYVNHFWNNIFANRWQIPFSYCIKTEAIELALRQEYWLADQMLLNNFKNLYLPKYSNFLYILFDKGIVTLLQLHQHIFSQFL